MIILKSKEEIDKIARASQVVAEVLQELRNLAKAGVTTEELDQAAERMIRNRKAIPAFKGYRNFPATLCVSVNEQVVHGIPSPKRVLKNGDIVGLDLGAICDGYYGDSAITVSVGEVPDPVRRLIEVTRESLERGIAQVREGGRLSDISHAVQSHVEEAGFSVVRDFVGHGIGRSLHEEPQIPNFGEPGRGPRLKTGMVLAIEPMVNMGGPEVKVLKDGWTAVTEDGSWSAHFEHTVAVSKDGPVVLSRQAT